MSNPFDAFDAPAPAVAAPPVAVPDDGVPTVVVRPQPAEAVPVAAASPVANPFDQFDDHAHPVAGPSGDLTVDIPRRLGSAGTDLLGGLLALPRTAAQGVDWAWGKLGFTSRSSDVLGGVQAPDGQPLFPDAATAKDMAYRTTGATEYVPQTALGRYVQSGLSAAPLGLAGGLRAVIPAMVGGGTGELAADMLPDHPIAGRVLGAVLGQHISSAMGNAVAKTVGAASGLAPKTPLYQAYERQGVPPLQTGEDALNAWHDAVERTAAKLGPSATLAESGAALQDGTRQWLDQFRATSAQNWNAFRDAVPAGTPIPVNGFRTALKGVNQDFGGADGLARVLQPSLGTRLGTALERDTAPPPQPQPRATGILDEAGNPISVAPSADQMATWLKAVERGDRLPWQAVQAVRTRLGEMMEGGQPIGDMSQSAIKRLYAGLSQDMRQGAQSAGPDAQRAWTQANAYTAYGHDLLDNHLNPILRATEPGKAAQYALQQVRQGSTRLQAIDHAVPGAAADLGATTLRQAAELGPGALPRQVAAMSPEARDAVFRSLEPPPPPARGFANIPSRGVNPTIQGASDLAAIGGNLRTGGTAAAARAEQSGSMINRLLMAREMAENGQAFLGAPGRIGGGLLGFASPSLIEGGLHGLTTNPALAAIRGTNLAPFSAPPVLSAPGLQQYLYQATVPRRDRNR